MTKIRNLFKNNAIIMGLTIAGGITGFALGSALSDSGDVQVVFSSLGAMFGYTAGKALTQKKPQNTYKAKPSKLVNKYKPGYTPAP